MISTPNQRTRRAITAISRTTALITALKSTIKKFGSNAHIYQPGVGGSYGPTNLLLNSGRIDNGYYLIYNSGTAVGSKTATYGTAPDGTQTSTLLSTSAGTGFSQFYNNFTTTSSISNVFTCAFQIKTANTAYLDFTGATQATPAAAGTPVDIGNGWYLHTRTCTMTSTNGVIGIALTPPVGGSIETGRWGLFAGSYTAAQLVGLGGIPLTTTASAAIYNAATVSGIQPYNYSANTGAANPDAVVDSTVGLMLDNGSTPGQLGSELAIQSTPDFTVAGFTKISSTITGTQQINLPTAGTSEVLEAPHGIQTANQTFLVTMTATGTGTVSFGVTNGVDLAVRTSVTLPGTFSFFAKLNSTSSLNGGFSIQRAVGDTATAVTVTAYSWKACYGIPASQPTAGSRPTLRRGSVNLLTYSQDYSNANWNNSTATKTAGQADPNGGTSATLITCAAVAFGCLLRNNVPSYVASTPYTAYAVVKAGGANYAGLRISDSCTAGDVYPFFDLTTGVGTTVTAKAGTITGLSSASVGNGWWLIAVNYTMGGTPTVLFDVAVTTNAGATNRTPSTSETIYVYRSGFTLGSVSAATILANGGIPLTTTTAASQSAGAWWGEFNGTSSTLSLASVPFQMSDDHAVIAVFNLSSNNSWVFSVGGGAAVFPSICSIGLNVSGYPQVYWKDDTSAQTQLAGDVIKTNVPVIVSAQKVGNNKLIRVNGVQIGATNTTALGTATVTGSAIGWWGVPAGGGGAKGQIGQVILIKGTTSATDLLTLERALGQQYGITVA